MSLPILVEHSSNFGKRDLALVVNDVDSAFGSLDRG